MAYDKCNDVLTNAMKDGRKCDTLLPAGGCETFIAKEMFIRTKGLSRKNPRQCCDNTS
jgi:hypothetical protein